MSLKKMTDFILHHSTFQDKGTRERQEDRYKYIHPFFEQKNLCLIMVCDGHAGQTAAQFLIERFPDLLTLYLSQCKSSGNTNYTMFMAQALKTCVQEWDTKCFGDQLIKIKVKADRENFFQHYNRQHWEQHELESGSTLCCVLLDFYQRKLHMLNLGDSRCTWMVNGKQIGKTVDHVVSKHMPPNEDFPFFISQDGYINDYLSMSRSFGDCRLFGNILRTPDLLSIDMGETESRLVVASDGFFDFADVGDTCLFEPFPNAEAICRQIPKFDDNITLQYIRIAPGVGPSSLILQEDNVPTCLNPVKATRAVSPKHKKSIQTIQRRPSIHKPEPTELMTQAQIDAILGSPKSKKPESKPETPKNKKPESKPETPKHKKDAKPVKKSSKTKTSEHKSNKTTEQTLPKKRSIKKSKTPSSFQDLMHSF